MPVAAQGSTQGLDATRPCVLVFAGVDPSGGAGISADIEAIAAMGAHALPVITVLTVQDNNRVRSVHPVTAELLRQQALALIDKIKIGAVKIGIVGSRANAEVIAEIITLLRQHNPALPVVLDPVLASGHGDALSVDDAVQLLAPLLPLATLIAPNLPEAVALCHGEIAADQQAQQLQQGACQHVLIKGGHGDGDVVINRWFGSDTEKIPLKNAKQDAMQAWIWPRLAGQFHGSGCTLASAIAAQLAHGLPMREAIEDAQRYCQNTLATSYAIAPGQRIPNRAAKF